MTVLEPAIRTDCVPPAQRHRRTMSAAVRADVARRYGLAPNTGPVPFPCHWCNRPGTAQWQMRPEQHLGAVMLLGLEWDHVVPLARGGTNHPDNLVWACPPCNRGRCYRLATEWSPACPAAGQPLQEAS